MVRHRLAAQHKEKLQTKKIIKKNLKKFSSDLIDEEHAEQVKVLCENLHFRRLVCRLNMKNKKSSLSTVLVEASHRILKEKRHFSRRYAFSQSQITELETEYQYNRYIGKRRSIDLARQLSIEELTLQRWFQRRRHKEKQQLRIAHFIPAIQHLSPLNQLQSIAG